jgi:hypothetical protein
VRGGHPTFVTLGEHYIFSAVLSGFARGKVIDQRFHDVEELARQKGLHGSEKAPLELLAASEAPAEAAFDLAARVGTVR